MYDDFVALLESQMSEEDDFDMASNLSEDCFGAFDDIFETYSFSEQVDALFPCGVSEENMLIIDD